MFTVNASVLLVPPGVVTLTVLAPAVAPVEIAKVAVTSPAFTTLTLLTVMPLPDTFTAVAPVRLVPIRVTVSICPRAPEGGEIEVNAGTGSGGAWNSTAPTSI